MSEGHTEEAQAAAVPPPLPGYAGDELANVVSIMEKDGSRWLWTGSGWALADPPGTHEDEMRFHHVVVPLVDLAWRAAREERDDKVGVERIRAMAGFGAVAAAEATDIVMRQQGPIARRAATLLSLASRLHV